MPDGGAGNRVTVANKTFACSCHPGTRCSLACQKPNYVPYLLAELGCAALRAELWLADIRAVELALRGGLITPEQAVANLADCDCLQFVQPEN